MGSVNANNSLFGYSTTGLPTGEWCILCSGRRAAWTGAEYQSFLSLVVTGGEGYLQASTQTSTGEVAFFYSSGAYTVAATGSPTTWRNFAIRRRSIGGGLFTIDVCWSTDGGTTLNKATIGDKGNPTNLTLLNFDTGGEQAANCAVRSCIVYNRNLSDAEILGQMLQEEPIFGGSDLNRFYRCSALATFADDESTNARDLTTSGTGTLDSSEPSKPGKTCVIWGSSVARGTYTGGVSVHGWPGGKLQTLRPSDLIVDRTTDGIKTTALEAAFATDVQPLLEFYSSKIVVFSEQINHVWNDGNPVGRPTARQAADAVWDCADLVIAEGAQFFVCTSTPVNHAIESILDDCNTLIRNEWGTRATSICDAGAIPEFNTGFPNSEYDTDQDTHLLGTSDTQGYGRLSNLLDATLDDPPIYSADPSGLGDFPFISTWLLRDTRNGAYRLLGPSAISASHGREAVLSDWFFGKETPTVGVAIETDLSQGITAKKRAATGLSLETDLAIASPAFRRATLGSATQTDTALALTATERQTVSISVEIANAFAPTSVKRSVVGVSAEADTARAITAKKVASTNIASENDSAFSLQGPATYRPVGRSDESSAALALYAKKLAPAGVCAEAELAFALIGKKKIAAQFSLENDATIQRIGVKRASIGLSVESCTALSPFGGVSVGTCVESNVAVARTAKKRTEVGAAFEACAAVAPSAKKRSNPGLSTETCQALSPVRSVGDLQRIVSLAGWARGTERAGWAHSTQDKKPVWSSDQ